jgi:hypothetical protein
MLDAFRRFIARPAESADWRPLVQWARARGAQFKRSRGGDGFVIEGRVGARNWRLEWGPPQRSYIAGHELRLRMELGLPHDLNLLVLSRPLMEALEAGAFERYTAQMQTRIDDSTPEEMRWLVMFPKAQLAVDKAFKQRFGVVALTAREAAVWVEGPLAAGLDEASLGALADDPPFVLMTLRGRLYLRLQLAVPDVQVLSTMLGLFETAAARAVVAAGGAGERPESGPSTATTAWQTQLTPHDIDR